MTKIIDASLLSKMIISGANNLTNNKELVDALNSQLESGDASTREEDEKKIHAIGAIMNVKLVIGENGVSIAE